MMENLVCLYLHINHRLDRDVSWYTLSMIVTDLESRPPTRLVGGRLSKSVMIVHFVRKLNDRSAKVSDPSAKFSDRSGRSKEVGGGGSVQILSFPCSFRQKITAPPGVGALSGKSWIRH